MIKETGDQRGHMPRTPPFPELERVIKSDLGNIPAPIESLSTYLSMFFISNLSQRDTKAMEIVTISFNLTMDAINATATGGEQNDKYFNLGGTRVGY